MLLYFRPLFVLVLEAAAASLAPFEPLPVFVSEAVAASFAPLFSLARGGCGGFGFFFGFLSLTSGLLPVWKLSRASTMSTRAVTQRVRELLELALLLFLGSQFLLGRIRGRFHARRALGLNAVWWSLAAFQAVRLTTFLTRGFTSRIFAFGPDGLGGAGGASGGPGED